MINQPTKKELQEYKKRKNMERLARIKNEKERLDWFNKVDKSVSNVRINDLVFDLGKPVIGTGYDSILTQKTVFKNYVL